MTYPRIHRPHPRRRSAVTGGVEALEPRRLFAVPWGAFPKLIHQDSAARNFAWVTGAGESIAVLDTGINYNHPSFGGPSAGGFGAGHQVVAGYDFVDNDVDPMDEDGHGTGVAGVAAGAQFTYAGDGDKYRGIAPGVDLIALRTSDGGAGTSWDVEAGRILQALDWVLAHRAQYNIVAVNLSTGNGFFTRADLSGDPYAGIDGQLADRFAALAGQGVFIAASSGNNGGNLPDRVEYPAADPNVYAVGSVNLSDQVSGFTSAGPLLDLLAPAENVTMPYYFPGDPNLGGTYYINYGNGTSFAAPQAAAAAALVKQIRPDFTPAQVLSVLQDSGGAVYDPATGLTYARLNLDAALRLAYSRGDDASEENDTTAGAAALAFTDDAVRLDGLQLLAHDDDYYRFTLASRADVAVAVTPSAGASPGFALLDSAGNALAADPSAPIVLNAGTYYIRVSADPSATLAGGYSLAVGRTPDDPYESNNAPAGATPLTFSGDAAGLSGLKLLRHDDDYYTFALGRQSEVRLALTAGGAAAPPADLLDAAGNVIAPAGEGAAVLLAAGTYYVKVTAGATTLAGSYALSLVRTQDDAYEPDSSAASAAPLTFAGNFASLSGLKLLGGDDDYYGFTLAGRADVTAALTADAGGAAAPAFELLDASGGAVAPSADGVAGPTVLAAGQYTLRVRAGASALPDAYSVAVAQAPDDAGGQNGAPASATPLTFAGNVAGLDGLRLLQHSDDYYRFTLDGSAEVSVALTAEGAAALGFEVLAADGGVVSAGAAGAVLLEAGTYYVRVVAGAATLPGPYAVSVARTPDDPSANHSVASAAPLPLADGHGGASGLTLLGGSDDYFAFTIDAVSDVTVAVQYAGTDLPAAQLLTAAGSPLADVGAGGPARRLAAGMYLLRVSSPTTLAGPYGVSVDAVARVQPGANAAVISSAYDARGTLHLAYYDGAARNLKYATRSAAGVWSDARTVDSAPYAGAYLSLALDAAGRPGIAYYDGSSADLKYAHFDGSAWALTTVDSKNTTGQTPSLAFNPQGRPVVAFYQKSAGDLRLAVFNGSAWSVQVVDSADNVGWSPSLAYDPATGTLGIGYEDLTHHRFKYAYYKKAWLNQVADASTRAGGGGLAGNLSLAFDRNHLPAMSYYDAAAADLKFARSDGKRWSAVTVAPRNDQGQFSRLTFAANNDPDVLYFASSYNAVFRATGHAGKWTFAYPASGGGNGLSVAPRPGAEPSLLWLADGGVRVADL